MRRVPVAACGRPKCPRSAPRSGQRGRQRGIALITALLVVAIAAAAAVGFALRDRAQIHRAELLQAQAQAGRIARAGETLAQRLLEQTTDYDALPWNANCRTPRLPLEIEGFPATVRLENLHCRFNVNALAAGDEALVQAFAALIDAAARRGGESEAGGVNRINGVLLANAVVDWMNSETDDPRYQLEDPPRRSGNRRMMLASELLQVDGFTPDLLESLAPWVTARPGSDTWIDREMAPDAVADVLVGISGENGSTRYLRLELIIEVFDRQFFHCTVFDAPNGRRVMSEATACEA